MELLRLGNLVYAADTIAGLLLDRYKILITLRTPGFEQGSVPYGTQKEARAAFEKAVKDWEAA